MPVYKKMFTQLGKRTQQGEVHDLMRSKSDNLGAPFFQESMKMTRILYILGPGCLGIVLIKVFYQYS